MFRRLLPALIALALLAPAASATTTGSVTDPTADATWFSGSAGYSATYDQCPQTGCTWRAVADAQDAMYPCEGDPFTLATAQIAWQSSDRHTSGTIATPPIGFTGPGRPLRLCLYLAVDDGGTTYTELAEASFTPNSLPGPAETFSALIAPPPPAPVARPATVRAAHHPRHRRHHRRARHA